MIDDRIKQLSAVFNRLKTPCRRECVQGFIQYLQDLKANGFEEVATDSPVEGVIRDLIGKSASNPEEHCIFAKGEADIRILPMISLEDFKSNPSFYVFGSTKSFSRGPFDRLEIMVFDEIPEAEIPADFQVFADPVQLNTGRISITQAVITAGGSSRLSPDTVCLIFTTSLNSLK